jgi:lipid-binding SYLF domain-containing protein
MEDIENMTHVLEKTQMPKFLSHELGTKITTSNTSATNGASQSQPHFGIADELISRANAIAIFNAQ